jgi:hypothetical protein
MGNMNGGAVVDPPNCQKPDEEHACPFHPWSSPLTS